MAILFDKGPEASRPSKTGENTPLPLASLSASTIADWEQQLAAAGSNRVAVEAVGLALADQVRMPSPAQFPEIAQKPPWEAAIYAFRRFAGKSFLEVGRQRELANDSSAYYAFERRIKPLCVALNQTDNVVATDARTRLAGYFNQLRLPPHSALTEADFRGVSAKRFGPDSLAKFTGVTLSPHTAWYLGFNGLDSVQSIYHRLTGGHGTQGFIVPGRAFPTDSPFHQGGVIVSCATRPDVTLHEIKHRLDPYLGVRLGKDRIIDELSTHYTELARGWLRFKGDPGSQRQIHHRLAFGYFDQVVEAITEVDRPSKEEFQQFVERLCDAVQRLHARLSVVEVDRILRYAWTADDIFGMAEMVDQEAGKLRSDC